MAHPGAGRWVALSALLRLGQLLLLGWDETSLILAGLEGSAQSAWRNASPSLSSLESPEEGTATSYDPYHSLAVRDFGELGGTLRFAPPKGTAWREEDGCCKVLSLDPCSSICPSCDNCSKVSLMGSSDSPNHRRMG